MPSVLEIQPESDSSARMVPQTGQVVQVRTRRWLVEKVEDSPGYGAVVSLACLDDDAQGDQLDVLWNLELDAEIIDQEAWARIGSKGFDAPRHFAAFLNTLRWHCVTATDPGLFQSPFRAGIKLDPYQLEPLQKALRLPRVNLFIADDVGLGKTIEAGLIASELLLRRRARDIVVACPPGMLLQWRDEMEARFGLSFEILDREFFDRVRRERGYSVNPWTTYPRFLISHRLLIDESYAAPLRDWLDNFRPGSLLIFDEAHHAAPSSGSKYAIDSKITRAVRDIAFRFEHRVFLSATPHNGHSNSFSALLEILDPQRFTRGVPVVKAHLDDVMVRRLKEDIRKIAGGFPKRSVVQIDITDPPAQTPELELSTLLAEYREVRQSRFAGASKRQQAQGALIISGLQQRLLSSVEAFARTLAVHRRSMEKVWAGESLPTGGAVIDDLASPDADDDRATLSEEELAGLFDNSIQNATLRTAGESDRADASREKALLDRMRDLADTLRGLPDAKVKRLVAWIKENCCLDGRWNDTRVIIFTEWDDTKRYLVERLREALARTDLADQRMEIFHGPTPPEKREAIKRAFNLPPDRHPVRILVATDAAREGINLQFHCHNLFHFDVPWNPGRLEQRNGRIDRKLQPAPEVFCRYFVYAHRPEDAVLRALVRKTQTIEAELGSLSKVLESRLTSMLRQGIVRAEAAKLVAEIDAVDQSLANRPVVEEELESSREKDAALVAQIEKLRRRMEASRSAVAFDPAKFQDALSCSLELLGASPLAPDPAEPARLVFPDLATRFDRDPGWADTLDTLRAPPDNGRRDFQWRKDKPIRPVVFEDTGGNSNESVHLHLGHRLTRRLLSRFLTQGFVHSRIGDLSRACLGHTADGIARVILLGRLSLYAPGASRLHEEIIPISARWIDPAQRKEPLKAYGRDAESRTLALLEQNLSPSANTALPADTVARLQASIAEDITELLPQLEERGQQAREDAVKQLADRAKAETEVIVRLLDDQRKRVRKELAKHETNQLLLALDTEEERRQLQSNMNHWVKWLENVEGDLKHEPERIRDFYTVSTARLEPVGLVYLWPVEG